MKLIAKYFEIRLFLLYVVNNETFTWWVYWLLVALLS
jgi:hypothetical protein